MRRWIAARCRIERGASPEQHCFRLALADSGEYVGSAACDFCHRPDGKRLRAEDLGGETSVEGLLEAWLVGVDGETAMIYLPGGETVRVARTGLVRVNS